VTPSSPTPGGMSTDELLRELDGIQAKAKDQQETLAANGRMPPPSPLLQHLRETEAAEAPGGGGAGLGFSGRAPSPAPLPSSGMAGGLQPQATPSSFMPSSAAAPAGPGAMGPAGSASGMLQAGGAGGPPLLRRRDDIGRFLEARQPRGLGVVLGVGRGDFALRLLSDWASSAGLYLIDPYIHIWQGYDDPSNLSDRDHQMVFEELRNRLAMFEGRYVLVRDFSHSFAETFRSGGTAPGLPTFVYVDANHAEKAVARDLELWWPLLAPGGVLAGSTYMDDTAGTIRVQTVVDRFVARHQLSLYLTHDDVPPSWFIFKS